MVAETLPLFPLSTVLLPGASLPLHVFEPRYRQLMHDLVTGTVPGESFGVVAIRPGWRTEIAELEQLHLVGCTARLRDVRRLPDGRFDIITTGERRFRLLDVDAVSAPYLCGQVEWIPDSPVPQRIEPIIPQLTAAARSAHRRYCEAAWRREDWTEFSRDVDAGTLANQLAADCLLSIEDRQTLLEQTCPAKRLTLLRRVLNRECGVLSNLRAVPVPLSELGPEAGKN